MQARSHAPATTLQDVMASEQEEIGDALANEVGNLSIYERELSPHNIRTSVGLKLSPAENATGPAEHDESPVNNGPIEEQKISKNKLRPEFRDMYIPDSWEEHTFEVLRHRRDPGGALPQQEDPVSTVLSIMEAATDLVRFVDNNPSMNKAELNAHANAVADQAEQLFGRAFMLHHLGRETDDYANVLKGTEGYLARDLTTPKTYEQALKSICKTLAREHCC